MKIGIIEAGAPPARLAESYPSYGRMVERLLGDPADVTIFPVAEGRFSHRPRGVRRVRRDGIGGGRL